MQIAMHTWMRVEPLEVSIARLARFGCDAVQIGGEPARYDLGCVRSLLRRHRLACGGCVTLLTAGRDLISPDPAVRQHTVRYVQDCLAMAHELGGAAVCVVPSLVGKLMPQADAETEWRWAVEGLSRCAETAQRLGIRIGLEPINRFDTYFLNRCDQALALADAVGSPWVGVILDAFHLNIEEPDLLAAIRAAGPRLVDFHVADNNRRPPGEGALDWRAILAVLREIGYEGFLSLEFVLPRDYTLLAAPPSAGAPAVGTSEDPYLRVHCSGDVSADYYDQCVGSSLTYLRRMLQLP